MTEQTQPTPDVMAELAELGQPAPEHELLHRLAGRWDVDTSWWTNPSGEPARSRGVATSEPILGGRYLATGYVGRDSEFRGQGLLGFDKTRGAYVQTWVDNMGTGVTLLRGGFRDDGTLEVAGPDICPFSGKPMTVRSVWTFVDEDHWRWEMFYGTADEGEAKAMECVYSRRT